MRASRSEQQSAPQQAATKDTAAYVAAACAVCADDLAKG
jgi:hypothetical protein